MGYFYGAFMMFLKLDRSEMSLWNHKPLFLFCVPQKKYQHKGLEQTDTM